MDHTRAAFFDVIQATAEVGASQQRLMMWGEGTNIYIEEQECERRDGVSCTVMDYAGLVSWGRQNAKK
jgi:hypothetical protein